MIAHIVKKVSQLTGEPLNRQTGKQRGQTLLEYVVVVACIVVAIAAMQFYMKRALCGRYRQAADAFGYGRQYEPGLTQIEVR